MSSNDKSVIKIGRNYWCIVRGDTTESSNVYKLKDVIRSGGEVPDFASSD